MWYIGLDLGDIQYSLELNELQRALDKLTPVYSIELANSELNS